MIDDENNNNDNNCNNDNNDYNDNNNNNRQMSLITLIMFPYLSAFVHTHLCMSTRILRYHKELPNIQEESIGVIEG
jgi:hypothetical protein